MIHLDDSSAVLTAQGGDAVITSVRAFPQQIAQSYDQARALTLPASYATARNIAFCGMGGSRFPGLIAFHLFKESLTIPFTICDDYTLPASVTSDTLVILSSYSGTTEEVLHLAEVAHSRSAHIVGFCAGGPLATWLSKHNYPAYVFDPVLNPSKQPRIGFGYAIGAVFAIFAQLRLLGESTPDTVRQDIERSATWLTEYARRFDLDTPIEKNEAKKLALLIHNRYPYLVLAEHLTGVGNAFQNQINETSKNIASYRVIPELNHHLMEGLRFPEPHVPLALFILFKSKQYGERIQKRFAVTQEVIAKNNIQCVDYTTQAPDKMSEVFEVAMLGSYVSMYLSTLYGVDPSKIPYVDYFKEQLKA